MTKNIGDTIKWIENASEKSEIVEKIILSLPRWFGIDSANEMYINEVKKYKMIASFDENKAVGFLSIKETSNVAVEIYLIGVLPEFHRFGIGKKLFYAAYSHMKKRGFKYFTVKTLDPAREDEGYQKTRFFYESLGFEKLETFPDLWSKENPCLMLIKTIE